MDDTRMEEERINAIKRWLEPESVQDIQVFIGFANFYLRFIKGFSKIAATLTAILKITRLSVASASRVNDNEIIDGRGTVGENAVGWSDTSRKSAKSKSQTKSRHLGNSNDLEESKFLTPDTKEAVNRLR